jgi:predicted Zn-dependent protease with MMP-like domain
MTTPNSSDAPHALDLAWSTLESNDPVATLDHLASFTEDEANAEEIEAIFGELILLQVLALLALGDVKAARSAMDVADATTASQPPALQGELANDADLVRASGEIFLAEWRTHEASEAFSRLLDGAEGEEAAAYHERLALCNDLLGDFEAADAHLESARGKAPLHITPDEFEATVQAAAQKLPAPFREKLDEIPVVIDPVPTRGLVRTGGTPGATPPDLLGLYIEEAPATIRIFQRNLERVAATKEELTTEIAVTLYHELAHALGLDEDGVDALGLA